MSIYENRYIECILIKAKRFETPSENKDRIEREEQLKLVSYERKKQKKIEKDLHEREQYEKLKRKFENEI